jgi:hypothetical protein
MDFLSLFVWFDFGMIAVAYLMTLVPICSSRRDVTLRYAPHRITTQRNDLSIATKDD